MESVTDFMMNVAASLYCIPDTEADLMERDFLKTRSPMGAHWVVSELLFRKWIWRDKARKLHCYKETVKKILNPAGYELD